MANVQWFELEDVVWEGLDLRFLHFHFSIAKHAHVHDDEHLHTTGVLLRLRGGSGGSVKDWRCTLHHGYPLLTASPSRNSPRLETSLSRSGQDFMASTVASTAFSTSPKLP